ncbi:MAG TPA: hypothetical protein VFT69_01305 [Pseudolabrys sp.]|nr:hypothetical protein [Pseudolabrys sp.]
MFAYVFWHTRSQATPRETYERNLLAFYEAFGAVDCAGVRHTATARISSMPWSEEESGYEDWAVIDGPGVLEGVNTKAVEGPMETSHAHIAQLMERGAGGLYDHLWGDLEPHRASRAGWLTRPRGIQFHSPLEKIAESAGTPVSVWRRFMVLGPGPEFIIFGSAPLDLQIPQGWQSRGVDRLVLPAK